MTAWIARQARTDLTSYIFFGGGGARYLPRLKQRPTADAVETGFSVQQLTPLRLGSRFNS